MRLLICDICQGNIKETESPFMFGVGTNHKKFVAEATGWEVQKPPSNPFARDAFKFVHHWELCEACGLLLLTVIGRAGAVGRQELLEFKKIVQ